MKKISLFNKALNLVINVTNLGLRTIGVLTILLFMSLILILVAAYVSNRDNRDAYDRFFKHPASKVQNLETGRLHGRGRLWARFKSTEIIFPTDFEKPYGTIFCKKSYLESNCAISEEKQNILKENIGNLTCWKNLDNMGHQIFIHNKKTGNHYFCYHNLD